MLLGKDPEFAFELIERLKLYPLVFLYDHATTFAAATTTTPGLDAPAASSPVDSSLPPLPDSSLSVSAARVLGSLLGSDNDSSLGRRLHPILKLHTVSPPPLAPHSALAPYPEPVPVVSSSSTTGAPPPPHPFATIYPHTLKRLYVSCGLLPLYDLATTDKKKTIWLGEKVVRDGIKGPTIDAATCKKFREAWQILHRAVDETVVAARAAPATEPEQLVRDEIDRVRLGEIPPSFASRYLDRPSHAKLFRADDFPDVRVLPFRTWRTKACC